MARERRQIRTRVDENLLTRLQAGVSGSSELATGPAQSPPPQKAANRSSGNNSPTALGEHGVEADRHALRYLMPHNRQARTTLSMPQAVGALARRLTMALTLLEERDVSLGITLGQALGLLERELRKRGARIPEDDIQLRSGKRDG